MWFFVLLVTAFLSVNSGSECSFDIRKLRCWCRDKNGETIFRIRHEMGDNSTWSVHYEVTKKECSTDDAKEILPPPWLPEKDGKNDTGHGDVIIDLCGNYTVFCMDDTKIQDMINKGYNRIGDSLYKVHTKGIFWDFARRTCIKEGSHLAIIDTDIEARLLTEYYQSHISLLENVEDKDSVFIGFHDIFQEGEYLTIQGTPLEDTGFYTWAENKPDNKGVLEEGEPGFDCGGLFKTATLTDLFCDTFYGFICEAEIRIYNSPAKANYSNGAYTGNEAVKIPPQGTTKRKKPGLGYINYPGFGFYRYHTTPVVYENARFWCQREGAYLAIMDSKEEVDLVKGIVKRIPIEFIKGGYKTFSVYTGINSNANETWDEAQLAARVCKSSEVPDNIQDQHKCQVKHPFICEKNLNE